MTTHQQSQLEESSLRLNPQIVQQLQKYKQQTEYVCLKLGVKDWMLFLTEVRTGIIIRNFNNNINTNINALSGSTKPFVKDQSVNQSKKQQSALQMLSDILEVKATKRNNYHQLNCNCESPICSEERIKYIQGSDTSRSESSASLVQSAFDASENQGDPFTQYKIQNLWNNISSANQISFNEAIKNIQQFDRERKEVQGFDTFRKVSYDERGRQIKGEGERVENNYQNTAKKVYNKIQTEQISEPSFERVDSSDWIKKSIDQDNACNLKEFLLAMQNTKLRRQIKHLQRMLNYYNNEK